MRPHTPQLVTAPSFSKRDRILSAFSLVQQRGYSDLLRTIAGCVIIITTAILTGCAEGGEGAPAISGTSSAAGATAILTWDPVADPTVSGYYVHYGTQRPAIDGSCAYEYSQFVSTPTATITNLARNTTYYFAVSAFNGLESTCSSEIPATTPI